MDTAQYIATMEAAYRAKELKLFSNIAETSYPTAGVPGGYPPDATTVPNDSLSRLNGNGPKVGPALVLKVMAGDQIDIAVKSFYRSQGVSAGNADMVSDVISSLASGIVGISGDVKGTLSQLNNSLTSPLAGVFNNFKTANNPEPPAGKPKAYLNWILLDERFNYVSSYPQSGALPVGMADQINALANTGIPVTKSGYLYIYVSNETKGWDVFFDNLSVKHYTGAMLEETHYYPFGLTMAGISSKALKPNYAENKRKYNGIEYDGDLDLDTYEAYYRNLDPQTARWWQIDPKIDEGYESVSPYASMYDDPIRYSDPLGDEADEADECCKVLKKIFASVSGAVVGTIDNNVPGSNLRGAVASSGIIEDPEVADAWNRGLDVADEAAIVQGVGESTGGAGLTMGSVAVTGGTGGLSIEVTGPAAALGLGLTVHGLFVTGKSINNLVSQNGRMHIEQTNSSSSGPKKNTSNSSSNSSQSKVEKSKKTESIAGSILKQQK